MFWWARCPKGRATRSNGGEAGRRGAIKRQRAETECGILMSGLDEAKEVISVATRSEDKYVADNEVGGRCRPRMTFFCGSRWNGETGTGTSAVAGRGEKHGKCC